MEAHTGASEPEPCCIAAPAGRRPVVNEPMVAALAISRVLEPVKEADVRQPGGPPAEHIWVFVILSHSGEIENRNAVKSAR